MDRTRKFAFATTVEQPINCARNHEVTCPMYPKQRLLHLGFRSTNRVRVNSVLWRFTGPMDGVAFRKPSHQNRIDAVTKQLNDNQPCADSSANMSKTAFVVKSRVRVLGRLQFWRPAYLGQPRDTSEIGRLSMVSYPDLQGI